MAGIFISYRRTGSQGFAGRLADDLIDRFGEERVFRDVEIKPGEDFSRVIEMAIASCGVFMVLIGPKWAEHRNSKGEPRLHETVDWVRLEIEAAFLLKTWVVPVLVGGARMPAAELMPESIRQLSRIQAFVLSDRQWDRDVRQLAQMIADRIPGITPRTISPLKGRMSLPNHHTETPEKRIRDLGLRILEDFGRKRRRAPSSNSRFKRSWPRIFSRLGRSVRRIISTAVVLGVIYFLVQNYGDPTTKRVVRELKVWILSLF